MERVQQRLAQWLEENHRPVFPEELVIETLRKEWCVTEHDGSLWLDAFTFDFLQRRVQKSNRQRSRGYSKTLVVPIPVCSGQLDRSET